MSLYDSIKAFAEVLKKAGNIDLYTELLSLGQQALDMQDEIRKLKEENAKLKESNGLKSRIKRHPEPYITLQGEDEQIAYCANCLERDNKLIQINITHGNGKFTCPDCNTKGIYDQEKYNNSRKTLLN